jgi:hypothetical protein
MVKPNPQVVVSWTKTAVARQNSSFSSNDRSYGVILNTEPKALFSSPCVVP